MTDFLLVALTVAVFAGLALLVGVLDRADADSRTGARADRTPR